MAVHLKGNLGLKSGVLAPTASKLSTQYLVVDHMAHHYSKIDKAGSCVDTGPPQSLVTSQKWHTSRSNIKGLHFPSVMMDGCVLSPLSILMQTSSCRQVRDGRLRDLIINSLHPQLTSSLPLGSGHQQLKPGRVVRQRSRTASRSQLLDKPMRNSMTFESAAPVEAYMYAHMPSQMAEPVYNRSRLATKHLSHVTAWPTFSSGYPHLSSVVIATHDRLRQTYSRDVLDVRHQYFTEPDKPFVPRTLKSGHESRLKHSACYNPARAASATIRQHESRLKLATDQWPQSSSQHTHHKSSRRASVEASHQEQSELMDITVGSRDGQYTEEADSRVRPVAMSRLQEHIQWLYEKSRSADIQESRQERQKPLVQGTEQLATSAGDSSLREAIKKELMKKDEENEYLMFAKEVTDDVISRGICSDSVVVRVCDSHMERRKRQLDLTRMRAVVTELLASIGLQDTSHRAAC